MGRIAPSQHLGSVAANRDAMAGEGFARLVLRHARSVAASGRHDVSPSVAVDLSFGDCKHGSPRVGSAVVNQPNDNRRATAQTMVQNTDSR